MCAEERVHIVEMAGPWTLLVYRIPAQPSKLRLNVWRKMSSLGALYLQDAVAVLPSRPELEEAFREIYSTILESGGTANLFTSEVLSPAGDEDVVAGFRKISDERLTTILVRLDATLEMLSGKISIADLEVAEESLKRERIAYLRAQAISYFGGTKEADVEDRLERLRLTLDGIRAAILG